MNRETDTAPPAPVFLYTGGAILALAVVAAIALYFMRGSHLELDIEVKSVRTLASDESHSIAIIDFSVTDLADVPWTVRSVAVSITTADGRTVEGQNVAEIDAQRLFEYYPMLGRKLPTLRMKETLKGRETQERMIAAQFDISEEELKNRKQLEIRVDELDGASSRIVTGTR